ncbi:amino acid transporter [Auricularia subglabra TFB-10046 SS5]|uniref:Amino acid transporter n=1 Tax=Auricularia subglabra (strain TFB-10046 / SS5) TaxID=717982 RepID=J0LG93_AURST|nr:amino acid transporter [Auricularia subglabra TFB-10046 SS5]
MTLTDDAGVLRACGYEQEFKRELSLFSSFSVSFSALGILPGIASTLACSLGSAGTVGLTWGWLLAWTGIQCGAAAMAELASSMPTSGGLYYAVGVLAPPGWGPFLAYLTGWSNWFGQSTAVPASSYGMVSILVALVKVYKSDFEVTTAQMFGLTYSLTLMSFFFAVLPTRWVARINTAMTWFNIAAYFVFIIGVPAAVVNRPRFRSSAEVWRTITNSTDWPDGIAVLLSFLTVIWTMGGYDTPFHLSEECANSQIATPRAIVSTAVITDVPAALQSPLGQPFVAALRQATSPTTTLSFGVIIIISGTFAIQAIAITCSRLAYAYARDGLLPASRLVSRVNGHTLTPVNACVFNLVVNTAFVCLIFAGPVTIGAVFSAGAVAAYFAFTMPVFLRCFLAGDRWRPGPWNLGKWGRPVGMYACGYVSVMLPILCFPAVRGANLTAQTMNWAVLVWGGPMFLATIYFLLVVRKTYKGPKVRSPASWL